ncbi:hypothetical protein ACLKA6_005649 [Drosophila palustris]
MSNASPGTEPTLPAEDHQLLAQNKLNNLEQLCWDDYNHEDTPTLRREYNGMEKEQGKEKEQTADTFAALDDNVLRYSYKGTPPELYSPKKEFLYTQPLVEKQVNTIILPIVPPKKLLWQFWQPFVSYFMA